MRQAAALGTLLGFSRSPPLRPIRNHWHEAATPDVMQYSCCTPIGCSPEALEEGADGPEMAPRRITVFSARVVNCPSFYLIAPVTGFRWSRAHCRNNASRQFIVYQLLERRAFGHLASTRVARWSELIR
jgi:hypothetical protein